MARRGGNRSGRTRSEDGPRGGKVKWIYARGLYRLRRNGKRGGKQKSLKWQVNSEAEDEFRDVFGADNIGKLNVKPVAENVAEIIANGLEFEARRVHREYDTEIKFYLRVKCEKCGKWFTYPIPCKNLADVGDIIMNRQKCDECEYGKKIWKN